MRLITLLSPRRRQRAHADGGFTLIELSVSMGILSIVGVLAMTVLISTMNISKVVTWQSASNFELRQLIDNVFSDIETARPALGCDENHDGQADTVAVFTSCGSKMVERPDPVLLMAGPKRLCYYSNKLQNRTTTNANPPYAPVCLAVVGTQLRLEIFDPPSVATDDWNLDVASRSSPKYHNLGTVDPSSATNDEYFQYFKPNSVTDVKGTGTKSLPWLASDETQLLSDADRADVISVLIRARVRLTGSTADRQRTRDIVYRITLRATRYSSERCGLGNATAGIACS